MVKASNLTLSERVTMSRLQGRVIDMDDPIATSRDGQIPEDWEARLTKAFRYAGTRQNGRWDFAN
jgi:hypothetical protein